MLVQWSIDLLIGWSVGLFVCWSIGPLIRWSAGPSVRWSIAHWTRSGQYPDIVIERFYLFLHNSAVWNRLLLAFEICMFNSKWYLKFFRYLLQLKIEYEQKLSKTYVRILNVSGPMCVGPLVCQSVGPSPLFLNSESGWKELGNHSSSSSSFSSSSSSSLSSFYQDAFIVCLELVTLIFVQYLSTLDKQPLQLPLIQEVRGTKTYKNIR